MQFSSYNNVKFLTSAEFDTVFALKCTLKCEYLFHFLNFLQIVREGLGCIKDDNPDEAPIKKVISRLMILFSSVNINLCMMNMHKATNMAITK